MTNKANITDNKERLNCSMCGFGFTLSEASHACDGCPVSRLTHCNRVRCPNCGFENVPPAGTGASGTAKSGGKGTGRGILSRLFGRDSR